MVRNCQNHFGERLSSLEITSESSIWEVTVHELILRESQILMPYKLQNRVVTTELYNYWRSGSPWKSESENMADFHVFWRQLVPSPWLLVPPVTTDQAHFWARYDFHTPWFFQNNFRCFLFFARFSVNPCCFWYFRYFFDLWLLCQRCERRFLCYSRLLKTIMKLFKPQQTLGDLIYIWSIKSVTIATISMRKYSIPKLYIKKPVFENETNCKLKWSKLVVDYLLWLYENASSRQ